MDWGVHYGQTRWRTYKDLRAAPREVYASLRCSHQVGSTQEVQIVVGHSLIYVGTCVCVSYEIAVRQIYCKKYMFASR